MGYKFASDTMYDQSSVSTSFTTDSFDFLHLNSGSFQVKTTTSGSVSWTITIEGSNDSENWAQLATPTTVTTGGILMFSVEALTSRYYRVKLTRTSGTLDTVKIIFVAKG